MRGHWKDRSFDARAWRTPAPLGAGAPDPAVDGAGVTGFVLGYVVAVPAVLAVLIALLKLGW